MQSSWLTKKFHGDENKQWKLGKYSIVYQICTKYIWNSRLIWSINSWDNFQTISLCSLQSEEHRTAEPTSQTPLSNLTWDPSSTWHRAPHKHPHPWSTLTPPEKALEIGRQSSALFSCDITPAQMNLHRGSSHLCLPPHSAVVQSPFILGTFPPSGLHNTKSGPSTLPREVPADLIVSICFLAALQVR
jgi:hypothetical protein